MVVGCIIRERTWLLCLLHFTSRPPLFINTIVFDQLWYECIYVWIRVGVHSNTFYSLLPSICYKLAPDTRTNWVETQNLIIFTRTGVSNSPSEKLVSGASSWVTISTELLVIWFTRRRSIWGYRWYYTYFYSPSEFTNRIFSENKILQCSWYTSFEIIWNSYIS